MRFSSSRTRFIWQRVRQKHFTPSVSGADSARAEVHANETSLPSLLSKKRVWHKPERTPVPYRGFRTKSSKPFSCICPFPTSSSQCLSCRSSGVKSSRVRRGLHGDLKAMTTTSPQQRDLDDHLLWQGHGCFFFKSGFVAFRGSHPDGRAWSWNWLGRTGLRSKVSKVEATDYTSV